MTTLLIDKIIDFACGHCSITPMTVLQHHLMYLQISPVKVTYKIKLV